MKYINMSGYDFDGVVQKRNPAMVNYAVLMDVLAVMFDGEASAKTKTARRNVSDVMVFIEVDPELQVEEAFFVELYKAAVEVIKRMDKSEFESCHVTIEKVSSITKL